MSKFKWKLGIPPKYLLSLCLISIFIITQLLPLSSVEANVQRSNINYYKKAWSGAIYEFSTTNLKISKDNETIALVTGLQRTPFSSYLLQVDESNPTRTVITKKSSMTISTSFAESVRIEVIDKFIFMRGSPFVKLVTEIRTPFRFPYPIPFFYKIENLGGLESKRYGKYGIVFGRSKLLFSADDAAHLSPMLNLTNNTITIYFYSSLTIDPIIGLAEGYGEASEWREKNSLLRVIAGRYANYGSGADGDVVISTNTKLTRDMQYRNLHILPGVTLDTAGYTVRVSGVLWNEGIITDTVSGGDGGAGGRFTPSGEAGKAPLKAGAGYGGGGGGRGGMSQGIGGSGGKGGGYVKIYAYKLNNTGIIHADGQPGSDGNGGAGGGGGGGGGTVFIRYVELLNKGTISAKGGAGGKGGPGVSGVSGDAVGNTGGSGGDSGSGEKGGAGGTYDASRYIAHPGSPGESAIIAHHAGGGGGGGAWLHYDAKVRPGGDGGSGADGIVDVAVDTTYSLDIKFDGLIQGQKVTWNDTVASRVVASGQTSVLLDAPDSSYPAKGTFKIYGTDGITLKLTANLSDLMGSGETWKLDYPSTPSFVKPYYIVKNGQNAVWEWTLSLNNGLETLLYIPKGHTLINVTLPDGSLFPVNSSTVITEPYDTIYNKWTFRFEYAPTTKGLYKIYTQSPNIVTDVIVIDKTTGVSNPSLVNPNDDLYIQVKITNSMTGDPLPNADVTQLILSEDGSEVLASITGSTNANGWFNHTLKAPSVYRSFRIQVNSTYTLSSPRLVGVKLSIFAYTTAINVTAWSVSDDRCDVGSTQTIRFDGLRWAHNGSLVSSGKFVVNGTTFSISNGSVVLTWSENVVSKKTFVPESVNAYGITKFNYKVTDYPSIIWDRVKIVDGDTLDDRINVGDTATVWFKAVYEYDGRVFAENVTGQCLTVNATNLLTGSKNLVWDPVNNRWNFSAKRDSVGDLTIVIDGVVDKLYGLSSINDAVGPKKVIWDKVMLTLSVKDSRINVGDNASISVSGIYEYDSSPWSGTVVLNDTTVKRDVSRYGYKVVSITDEKYGLTVFETNEISIIFDKLHVEFSASKKKLYIGETVTISWRIKRLYDDSDVTDFVIDISRDGKPWKSGLTVSSVIDKETSATSHTYDVSAHSVLDKKYGLTAFTSTPVTVTWIVKPLLPPPPPAITKTSSTITCNVSSEKVVVGESIIVSGKINPPHVATVIIKIIKGFTGLLKEAKVLSSSDGSFSYTWTPPEEGRYFIFASWEGDEDHYGAQSGAPMVEVISPSPPTRVKLKIIPVKERFDIGSEPEFKIIGWYSDTGLPFNGTVEIQGKTLDVPGRSTFRVVKIHDPVRGILEFEADPVDVIFDKVVLSILKVINENSSATIFVEARYAYDGHPIKGALISIPALKLNATTDNSGIARFSIRFADTSHSGHLVLYPVDTLEGIKKGDPAIVRMKQARISEISLSGNQTNVILDLKVAYEDGSPASLIEVRARLKDKEWVNITDNEGRASFRIDGIALSGISDILLDGRYTGLDAIVDTDGLKQRLKEEVAVKIEVRRLTYAPIPYHRVNATLEATSLARFINISNIYVGILVDNKIVSLRKISSLSPSETTIFTESVKIPETRRMKVIAFYNFSGKAYMIGEKLINVGEELAHAIGFLINIEKTSPNIFSVAKVKVHVTDNEGRPVAGINVTLSTDGRAISSLTTSDGIAKFEVPVYIYPVRFEVMAVVGEGSEQMILASKEDEVKPSLTYLILTTGTFALPLSTFILFRLFIKSF